MTKAMIRRIKKIENYRIFQNWKPSGGVEFARVNLIYGQNGSGKSTLASLMRGCAAYASDQLDVRDSRHAEVASSGVQLTIEIDGTKWDVDMNDGGFWGRVRVFNKDFIRRNLAFDNEGGSNPHALLTIGEVSVDAEERLKILRPELVGVQSKIGSAEKVSKSVDSEIEKRLTEVARVVTDALLGTQVSEYNPRSYTKRKVKQLLCDFDSDRTVFDGASNDLAADREAAIGEAKAPVQLSVRQEVLGQGAVADARALLGTDVVNEVIDALQGDPERSEWVQKGVDLHKGLDECLFCGQPLTASRRAELDAHFDDSFTGLQSGIDALVGRLEASVTASKTYLDSIPADLSVYEDLKVDLQQARTAYQEGHDAYSQAVKRIVVALKKKRGNPFGVVGQDLDVTLNAPDTERLEKVVAEHAEKISKHDDEVRAAARRIELYHVKQFAGEYKRLKKDAEDKKSTAEALKKKARDLEERIHALENVDADPVPGAGELTGYVSRLLGRDELEFSVTDDGKHYVIKRDGKPASNLSEGEQTAVALLYFLVSVREDKVEGDPPIVIIDDPVSSLDSGILFGASSYIWSELVAKTYVSQVFLMTHNFELFRQWLIQLEARQQHEGCDYAAYEMAVGYAPRGLDSVRRTPRLDRWETDKGRAKVMRSEYHFLFSRVARSLVDRRDSESRTDQMNELALMPNAARRMLEAFLSFKCPENMGSFHLAIEEVMGRVDDLDAGVRARVERYLHTYSHFDGGDISQPLKLSEVATVLRSLFLLMDRVDHEHVTHMCAALGVDRNTLLGVSATTSAAGGSTS